MIKKNNTTITNYILKDFGLFIIQWNFNLCSLFFNKSGKFLNSVFVYFTLFVPKWTGKVTI